MLPVLYTATQFSQLSGTQVPPSRIPPSLPPENLRGFHSGYLDSSL